MFDAGDEAGGGEPPELRRVLLPGREPRADGLREVHPVVADDRDVLRDTQLQLAQGVDAADAGVIVREEDAARPLRQREEPLRRLITAHRLVVVRLDDVLVRHLDPEALTGPVEAGQAVFRDRGAVAVDVGEAAVAPVVYETHQRLHALHVVGEDGRAVVERVVERDHGEIGVHQLLQQRIVELHADDRHPVDAPVQRVLQIAPVLVADVGVDEGDVVAAALGLDAEAVERGREILMREAGVLQVDKEDAEVVGPVGLERAGGGVGGVAHLLRALHDALTRRLADVLVPVEGLADGGDRDAAAQRDILH